jgi:hypothetical protein
MILTVPRSIRLLIPAAAAAALFFTWTAPLGGQITTVAARVPHVELVSAPRLQLTGEVDSNSPVLWDRVNGRRTLFVMTSIAGLPSTASGRQLELVGKPAPITLDPWPGGGIWMEAVVADEDGTWYGYYHNENPARVCGSEQKMIPRIGAARSSDRGQTWEPLGVILEAPPRTYECMTTNKYFVGGVGDLSVQLDHQSRDLYFFYSTYLRTERLQGVAVARLAWADRDDPSGKMMLWRDGVWVPVNSVTPNGGMQRFVYPAAAPIFPAKDSWHDEDAVVDAFWGPSVHWNTFLQQYVMLLNHAKDDNFAQEGIYVSFATDISDPRLWSPPVKILNGGRWYPQVIGLQDGEGTDKVAGEWPRFFMSGTSQHLAHFIK